MAALRARRASGRVDVGVGCATIAIVAGIGVASAVWGTSFTAWPLWGKLLVILGGLGAVVIGLAYESGQGFRHDSDPTAWRRAGGSTSAAAGEKTSPPPDEPTSK